MNFIKKKIEKIKSSSMIQNMARISGGTMLGQIISVVTLPLCSRLYGDKIIGEWTFLTIISTIAAAFADLGLQQSVMIEKDGKDLQQTLSTQATLIVAISVLVGVGSYIFFGVLAPNSVSVPPFFSAIFITLAVYTTKNVQVYSFYVNRQGDFDALMKNPVINTAVFGVLAIVLGALGFTEYGYYIGWMAGQVATLLHLMRGQDKILLTLKLSDYKAVFKRNERFVKYQFPADILAQVKAQFPGLLIKPLFGTEILGQYSITWRVINLPINALGSAIGRVFLAKTSEMKREGQAIGPFTYKSLVFAMKIAVLPIVGILALGDIVMVIFLGPEWVMAGNMVRILSIYAFFWFLTISLQGLTVTLEKQHFSMISATVQIIGISIGLFVGHYVFNSIYWGLALWTLSFVTINIIYFCALLKTMDIKIKKYLRNIAICLLLIALGYAAIRIPLYLLGFVPTL